MGTWTDAIYDFLFIIFLIKIPLEKNENKFYPMKKFFKEKLSYTLLKHKCCLLLIHEHHRIDIHVHLIMHAFNCNDIIPSIID